jgi:hypothetical protein
MFSPGVCVFPLALLYGIYFTFLLGYELKEKQYNIFPPGPVFFLLGTEKLVKKMNGGKKNGIFSPLPYFSPLDHAVFGSPSQTVTVLRCMKWWVLPSVADPGCLSRIPDLGSWIPDPKMATKERGEKKLLSYIFL